MRRSHPLDCSAYSRRRSIALDRAGIGLAASGVGWMMPPRQHRERGRRALRPSGDRSDSGHRKTRPLVREVLFGAQSAFRHPRSRVASRVPPVRRIPRPEEPVPRVRPRSTTPRTSVPGEGALRPVGASRHEPRPQWLSAVQHQARASAPATTCSFTWKPMAGFESAFGLDIGANRRSDPRSRRWPRCSSRTRHRNADRGPDCRYP